MTKLNRFDSEAVLVEPWRTFNRGSGRLDFAGDVLRFINDSPIDTAYSNAQIDDYQSFSRRDFRWRPPLRLTVEACFSHPVGELRGTAGFGFWNDPFMMTGARRPTLPRVIWFFYSSEPSNMKLDRETPGPGWKAGTLDAWRWPFFALLPTAPLAVPLMNVEPLYRLCWPIGQRAIGVRERLLPVAMTDWHTYTLAWRPNGASFYVDGNLVLESDTAPRGPLGFVVWLDNQFMVMTPWGQFNSGLVSGQGEQWLAVRHIEISAPE